jgi:hypothetical protein
MAWGSSGVAMMRNSGNEAHYLSLCAEWTGLPRTAIASVVEPAAGCRPTAVGLGRTARLCRERPAHVQHVKDNGDGQCVVMVDIISDANNVPRLAHETLPTTVSGLSLKKAVRNHGHGLRRCLFCRLSTAIRSPLSALRILFPDYPFQKQGGVSATRLQLPLRR